MSQRKVNGRLFFSLKLFFKHRVKPSPDVEQRAADNAHIAAVQVMETRPTNHHPKIWVTEQN